MNTRAANFRFIDLPSAAERLGTTRNTLLEWVAEGRIKPFTGSGQQSVFRAADVDRLAEEILAEGAVARAAEEAALAEQTPAEEAAPARSRRRDPIKILGTRLSQDSRWAEISDADVATYLDALEPVQFDRVRRVCAIAIQRLQYLAAQLDEQERRLARTPTGSEARE